ncbi:phosphopentomutase [Vulcanibacillus modesticaldus]|uniref:Phosphopentomutase n=1 Tax=Vulcanibacillus modesticaldus TaxID=337097 RepID=A0A1D2YSE5_9BACI|nr:phosphopentomutase [Vulcanibacillus modesticaldus]OEF97232.1 phosphopentomutase [Vulcanibacillus modesticaldus]
MKFNKIALIVLDSLGIGALPDANEYGDQGTNTFAHIAEKMNGLNIPNMGKLGVGNIHPIAGVTKQETPIGAFGKMGELSVGKDTMTGHWEMMGLKIDTPFKTYPDGFPESLIKNFEERIGRKVIGNKPASGTEIINELGEEHVKTGAVIVYTSADSVFQIAAHEEIVPLEELYKICEVARELTLSDEYLVGRVIARPFIGEPGSFQRTPNRKDYSVKPPSRTVMNNLVDKGFDSISVGKIADIYANEGITKAVKSKSNMDGVDKLIAELKTDFKGLIFTNLVDFDMLYGHRRDPIGYGKAIEEFDTRLPEIMDALGEDGLLIITADHGNDPTHGGTDHTREYVPLLVYSKSLTGGVDLGIRKSFADIGATISDNFGIQLPEYGESFLEQLK